MHWADLLGDFCETDCRSMCVECLISYSLPTPHHSCIFSYVHPILFPFLIMYVLWALLFATFPLVEVMSIRRHSMRAGCSCCSSSCPATMFSFKALLAGYTLSDITLSCTLSVDPRSARIRGHHVHQRCCSSI